MATNRHPDGDAPRANRDEAPDCAECPVQQELEACREENRRLSEALRTDPLTGLFNHAHFEEMLGSEMERTRRAGAPVALVMFDLDRFKDVNDNYGHEAGNKVLRFIGGLLRRQGRRMDTPCRYGGEEFAVIMPAQKLPDAVCAAERLRELIASQPLELNGNTVTITASFGVDVYTGTGTMSAREFVHAADGYLYTAKQNGRNRVAHPPMQSRGDSQVSADEKALLLGPSHDDDQE